MQSLAQLSNKDVANVWIAYMLGELHAKWPKTLEFAALDIGAETNTFPADGEEDDLFDDTMDWLVDEGYLRIKDPSRPGGQAFGVALTEKAHVLLGFKPDSLQPELGGRLKAAAKDAAKEGLTAARNEGITQLVGLLIGSAVKGLSS